MSRQTIDIIGSVLNALRPQLEDAKVQFDATENGTYKSWYGKLVRKLEARISDWEDFKARYENATDSSQRMKIHRQVLDQEIAAKTVRMKSPPPQSYQSQVDKKKAKAKAISGGGQKRKIHVVQGGAPGLKK